MLTCPQLVLLLPPPPPPPIPSSPCPLVLPFNSPPPAIYPLSVIAFSRVHTCTLIYSAIIIATRPRLLLRNKKANHQRSRVVHKALDLQGEAQGDIGPIAGGGTLGGDALAGRHRQGDHEHRKRELHGRARVHAPPARVPQRAQVSGPNTDTLFGRDPVDR